MKKKKKCELQKKKSRDVGASRRQVLKKEFFEAREATKYTRVV